MKRNYKRSSATDQTTDTSATPPAILPYGDSALFRQAVIF